MTTSPVTVGQIFANGIYRIASARHPGKYFEYQENGRYDVRPMPSSKSDLQRWEIKGNTAAADINTYTITNVASKLKLAIRSDVDKEGNKIWRLSAFTDGNPWTIEPRADQWVIGFVNNEQCIDYSEAGGDDWLILWQRNDLPNQRWVIEPSPSGTPVPPEAGKIKVVNNSSAEISVFVTKWSNANGSDAWFKVPAGGSEAWARSGNEGVMISTGGTAGSETGVYVAPPVVVNFQSVGHPGISITR